MAAAAAAAAATAAAAEVEEYDLEVAAAAVDKFHSGRGKYKPGEGGYKYGTITCDITNTEYERYSPETEKQYYYG